MLHGCACSTHIHTSPVGRGIRPTQLNFSSPNHYLPCFLHMQISLLLLLVPAIERKLGQSSFLVLIGALLSPPNEPFTAIVRRELSLITAVCLCWAWSVIGFALADLTRTPPKQPIDQAAIYSSKYMGQVAVSDNSYTVLLLDRLR